MPRCEAGRSSHGARFPGDPPAPSRGTRDTGVTQHRGWEPETIQLLYLSRDFGGFLPQRVRGVKLVKIGIFPRVTVSWGADNSCRQKRHVGVD